jgi:hypothetical protein
MRKSLVGLSVLVFALSVASTAAFAGKAVKLTANLVIDCPDCGTNVAPRYSLLPDSASGYPDGNGVKSQILTNNSVYTLDTLDTLVNGVPGPGTRTVQMHFYSPVEGLYPGHVLPACWLGDYDQDQAVNWSVFAYNSQSFVLMQQGVGYPGWARLDFNVRNGVCDRQIYRYYLRWYGACIVRTGPGTWEVTSGGCGQSPNYGEANLRGQGGRKSETINYGDWRLPFKLTLTQ